MTTKEKKEGREEEGGGEVDTSEKEVSFSLPPRFHGQVDR
jgi:hypothetical protein